MKSVSRPPNTPTAGPMTAVRRLPEDSSPSSRKERGQKDDGVDEHYCYANVAEGPPNARIK